VTKPTHIIDISSTIDTPKSHFDGKISETTQRKEWKKTTRIRQSVLLAEETGVDLAVCDCLE
jgi:hypothetical protein